MIHKFEGYELDTDLRELRSGGELCDIQPQVFDILRYLIENHDRLVSRDELVSAVWRGRVVSESAIDSRVHAARKAVGDNGRKQARVRTVPRHGYRFIAAVTTLDGGESNTMRNKVAVEGLPDLLADKPSIAVLPFANQSGDPEQTYFVDGFTDEIIAALSKFRWFVVTAGGPVVNLSDRVADVRKAGDELGVRYLLQGSVRRTDRDLRISVRLVEVATNLCIWAGHFDRGLENLFELQDEIAATIVGAIEPEIAVAERKKARRKPTEHLNAWDHCQRGFWHFWRLTKEYGERAQQHFQTAIETDPNLGAAYAGQALLLTSQVLHGWLEDKEAALLRAEKAANTAVSLDESDALAFAALGRIHTTQWRFRKAISELALSLELNPNLTYALNGMGVVLFWSGRAFEAIRFFEQAIRQSPRDPARWVFEMHIGFCRYALNEPEEAIDWFERALAHPGANFWPHLGLAMTYAVAGRSAEAEAAVAEARRQQPGLTLRQIAPVLEKPEGLQSAELLKMSGLPEA